MTTRKRFLALATASALAVPVAAAPAQADPIQRGLVNVNVGDVTVAEDVNVAVAANVAAQVCGVAVPVAVIAQAAAFGNTVCNAPITGAPVTITR